MLHIPIISYTQGMSDHSRRTLYLDLDGVILPHWHKSDGGKIIIDGESIPRHDLQPGLEPTWIDRDFFYYPEIAKRLGELSNKGVVIIPSSSRSIDLISGYPELAHELGKPDKYLFIDDVDPSRPTHKAEAILNHWQGIADAGPTSRGWEVLPGVGMQEPALPIPDARAVWVDDHAHPDNFLTPRSLEIVSEPSIKIIRPMGWVGLTMAEIDQIEEFLL